MYRSIRLLALMLAADLAACAVGRAGVEGDPPLFHAGEVHAGAPLSHRFTLVNRGPDAAEVVEVRPSCGCVTATPDRRRFGPGETGSLLLEVNSLTQPDGPASWRVTLLCRCGDRIEETALTLTAAVRADVTLEPTALVVVTEGAVERTVRLTDRRPQPLTVLKADTTSPLLRARLDGPSADKEGRRTYVVHLEALADLPEGRHDEALHLYTSDPEYPDLKMPFTIVKRSRRRVSATPEAVELTPEKPSRLVLLHGGDGDEVEIGGVDADAPAVHCEWAAGARPTAAVRVRIDRARAPADGLKTTVHIRLVKPAARTVDVPVTWAPR